MFSKELEALIQATIVDGRLDEKEKSALANRAQKEGVDLVELDVYINSLLQKRQQEFLKEDEQKEKERLEKVGMICPKCHKQVPPLTLVCDCGYEFIENKKESSVQKLSDKLEKIHIEYRKRVYSNDTIFDNVKRDNLETQEIADAISMFPVPNTKEDIMEFLALAVPNSKEKGGHFGTVPKRLMILIPILAVIAILLWIIIGGEDGALFAFMVVFWGGMLSAAIAFGFDRNTLRWNKMAAVWRSKAEQVLMKGRSLRADLEFTKMLDYYEGLLKN